jgi:PglZ domain
MELIANRSVVEHELKRARGSHRSNLRNRVLLLRAAPEWRSDTDFTFDDNGTHVAVTVAPCRTVLAVLDALSHDREDGRYLVVLTPCDSRDVGESVLARAMQPEIKPVNRWDLVRDAFGARQLDPALVRSENGWIAEALLDAQPAGGWRRLIGTVLTWATALNRLAATRLGIEDADDSPVDAAALLQWTTDAPAVASFLQLRKQERDGLIGWLMQTAGAVADVVFGMTAADRISDAVPFGLLAVALYGADGGERDGTVIARVRAEERYLAGKAPDGAALRAFGEAAESLVTRWADTGRAPQAAALCERAEVILAELSDSEDVRRTLASRSAVLEAGMDARLAALAEALSRSLTEPTQSNLALATEALDRASRHGRKRDHGAELRAATAAVRLTRWLATPGETPATLAEAATRMLRSWSWADRALAGIERAGTSRVPWLGEIYAKLWTQVRQRRAALDEAFARKLASWTETGSATDLICVENVLERIARPVAGKRLPVIVVLDGMSVAVATELADELAQRGIWLEAGRQPDGREPALATVPSVTGISRTSLLTGRLQSGGQAEERAGFAQFWGRQKAVLFHKGDLAPDPGMPLSGQVRDAISDPGTVVGVVLNTIDDTLDKGKPGGPAHWTVETVTYLRPVLDEARRAGRPVILTADHGHVLDRGAAANPAQSATARYRAGAPGPGEITVRGPRVLPGGGEVVAAVEENIRYTPRKGGYHGGASPAEVVVAVITLLPSASLLPAGWTAYDAIGHAPSWWTAPAVTWMPVTAGPVQPEASVPPAPARRKRAAASPANDGAALFGVSEATPTAAVISLGTRIVASPRMAGQRQFVRRAPDDSSVAALIDALAQAGGRLTLTEAAAAAGEPPVRMSDYLAQVTRLLNVDSYAVLQTSDAGRTVELNIQLLRQQFT